jgi:hypothetical protein
VLAQTDKIQVCGATMRLMIRGGTWNGWDTSFHALNVLNSHPLPYNTALETAQFVGPTYTIRPLTVGARVIYRW